MEYARLVVAVGSVTHLGYERDGDGIVEVALRVTNEGEASSGQFDLGVTCAAGLLRRELLADPAPRLRPRRAAVRRA